MEELTLGKRNILTVVEELEGNSSGEYLNPDSIRIPFDDSLEDIPDLFVNAVDELKEKEKNHLNEQLREYLGNDFMTIDDFPDTMAVLDATFQSYLSEYETSGGIDLDRIRDAKRPELYKIFYREVYDFLKKALSLLEES